LAYIGNTPAEKYSAFQKQDFTTSATTSYTLDNPVANANELALFINFVRQEPTSSYSASGTSLTLTEATSVGDDMYCVYLGKAVQTVNPPNGSVDSSKINYPLTTFSSTGIDDNATSTAITIDSSQNVGIGDTSPDGSLHITRSGSSSQFVLERTTSNTGKFSIGINNGLVFNDLVTSAERMRIDSSGNVLIGKTTTATTTNGANINTNGTYLVARPSGGSAAVFYYTVSGASVGKIQINASSTSYVTSSDYRLKENVVEITNATERLKQLQPKRFNFIADADTTVDGFLAHEVSSVVPEAITGTHNEVEVWKEGEELPEGVSVGDNKLDENGNTIPVYQGIDQSKLVPLLVKTIQELEARITELENK
jgi:hypothetical protein